jgi:hypothetical protein
MDVFSVMSDPKLHNQNLVEAGSNTSTVTLRVIGGDEKGSLNLRQSNMVSSTKGLRWQGPVAYTKDRPVHSSERVSKKIRKCQTIIKIWSQAPDGCFMPRQTGQLTGRKMRLRLRLTHNCCTEPGLTEALYIFIMFNM